VTTSAILPKPLGRGQFKRDAVHAGGQLAGFDCFEAYGHQVANDANLFPPCRFWLADDVDLLIDQRQHVGQN
jgi:hypothetical protein